MKLAFIGGGNMGVAIMSAILDKGLCKPWDITVSDKSAERLEQLRKDFCVSAVERNTDAATKGDIIILAVKPQNLNDVMSGLKGRLKPGQLVISIIAGKTIATLQKGLEHNAVVRAMPNTPAQIGIGMTVWTSTPEVTIKQKETAASILGVMGKEVYAGDEAVIDMATAVSGSGPAYVFLFMESLIEAAVETGLELSVARKLVLQTVSGAAEYARQSDKELAELRRMVTSPGGTTAEALKVFEQADFTALVKKAVAAAHRRAKELGG